MKADDIEGAADIAFLAPGHMLENRGMKGSEWVVSTGPDRVI